MREVKHIGHVYIVDDRVLLTPLDYIKLSKRTTPRAQLIRIANKLGHKIVSKDTSVIRGEIVRVLQAKGIVEPIKTSYIAPRVAKRAVENVNVNIENVNVNNERVIENVNVNNRNNGTVAENMNGNNRNNGPVVGNVKGNNFNQRVLSGEVRPKIQMPKSKSTPPGTTGKSQESESPTPGTNGKSQDDKTNNNSFADAIKKLDYIRTSVTG